MAILEEVIVITMDQNIIGSNGLTCTLVTFGPITTAFTFYKLLAGSVYLLLLLLLPLDEALASRTVFVIVSGRKCFWSQLNNSKTVTDGPYMLMGS